MTLWHTPKLDDDRLGHHAEAVVIEGQSYRMRGKEKEEDVKPKKK